MKRYKQGEPIPQLSAWPFVLLLISFWLIVIGVCLVFLNHPKPAIKLK